MSCIHVRVIKQPSSTAEEEVEEVPEEPETEEEPELIPEVETELDLEPELDPEQEPEAILAPILNLYPDIEDPAPVLELKSDTWDVKDSEEEAREEVRGQAEGCLDPKMEDLCKQDGISTQQVKQGQSCAPLVICSYISLSFPLLCLLSFKSPVSFSS